MLNKKLIIVVTTIGILASYYSNSFAANTDCSKVTKKQVEKAVKDDFLNNRAPFWPAELMGNIGTKKPEITFNEKVIVNKNTYGMPFLASGPKNKANFIAIYNCKTGVIEYSKE
jgi:hypothetical protein